MKIGDNVTPINWIRDLNLFPGDIGVVLDINENKYLVSFYSLDVTMWLCEDEIRKE